MRDPFDGLAFRPADILLPQNCEYTKWSVVACDQYTSQPEYWQEVEELVGSAPSTLRLILPESCLDGPSVETDIMEVNNTMTRYLREERFCTLPASLIYVERRLDNLRLRRGLVGMVDLEQYDYEPGAEAQVRATEGTVMARIPPRVAVRKNAPLELPHVMLLADDPEKTVLEPLSARKDQMEKVYDFDLMERGGHIAGWRLDGESMALVAAALRKLADPAAFRARYGVEDKPVLLFAVGDGNHSLATAKECYERQKKLTPREQWDSLPARYAPSGGSLAPAAAAAFMRMADAAREDGITLYSVSAYRSYSYQDSLYRRYTAQDGVEADTYSARPGFSEHQTGLALDINTASRSAHFETTATYRWLIENCWRYGFILRYPEGREDITGFCFEPWHYRFVGRTLALQVRESGLTYDEFLARRAVDRPHTALCAGDMPLEAVPILLDGICWLPAQAVAAAFGRTAAISGDQLVLPAEEGSVVLTAGSLTGERDDRPFALSSLPFQWEGEFYLSLEDLCALLELTARREEGLISLVPRSAPSALLPEELPPIQPLPC